MSVDPVIEFLFALSDDEQIREEERSDATRMLRVRLHRFVRPQSSWYLFAKYARLLLQQDLELCDGQVVRPSQRSWCRRRRYRSLNDETHSQEREWAAPS
ncbi:MAG: hypothetical protein RIS60_1844 [Pseudomonadota bacterium]